jgi:hypothetical protein
MWQAPSLEHLVALTDETGLLQHAIRDVPNREYGYCTDDVSRGFIVACGAARHTKLRNEALRLARIYLSFLHDAQLPDGRFHNFMSYDRRWLDEVGTEDSIGRAIWSLGIGVRHAPRSAWRDLCAMMLERAVPIVGSLNHLRSLAYASLGLSEAYRSPQGHRPSIGAALREIGTRLAAANDASRAPDWEWLEPTMTYDNARLPEALLRIGQTLEDDDLIARGLRTFEFYQAIVVEDGVFVPIGNGGWYPRGGYRARYGQQPIEAAAMVDASLVAHALSDDVRYRRLADIALEWFYGRNSRNVVMAAGGGSFDGLDELGVNRNMGAESTLAYLSSALALAQPAEEVLRIAR